MTDVSYDAAFPNIAKEVAAPVKPLFLFAYTDGTHAYTKAEIQAAHAAGVGICANHENSASQLLGGTNAGHAAALAACAAVLAWDMPADGSCAIFYSVDVSVPTSQFAVIGQAFDAIKAVHAGRFKVGVYGEGALIDYLVSTGRVQVKGWLSGSSSFPGYNRADANVGVYQLVGTDVAGTDKDIVTDAGSLGVWWPNGVVPDGVGIALTSPADVANAVFAQPLTMPDGGAAQPFGSQWYEVFIHARSIDDKVTALATALASALQAISALSQQLAALDPSSAPVAVDTAAITAAAQTGAAQAINGASLALKFESSAA